MNNLDLKKLGVQEMDAKEIVEVDGGFTPVHWAMWTAAAAVAITAYDAVTDFAEGFAEGFKRTYKSADER